MNNQVVEFDIDKKNLLRDVISKQTGSLNKAIKELFQNAFDAKATEIRVKLTTTSLIFTDNGSGMDADNIWKYFRVFGATSKRGNDNKTGNFGMGRGQIFNFGLTTWKTQNYKMTVDIKKSLDYKFEEGEEYLDGTAIEITFYQKLYSWGISDKTFQIKRDILPTQKVKVFLNDEQYIPTINEYKDFSNDKYLVFTSKDHRSMIYNGGLAIKPIKNSNYKYSIQPHGKLQLNFARNELIETAESTKELNYFIDKIEELMASKKDKFNLEEALNILRLLASKRIKLESVYNKKIIPMSNDKLVSFKELIDDPNMGVLFGKKNVWSDDCIRQDYKVISDKVMANIKRIKANFNLTELEFLDKKPKDLSKRGYFKDQDLTQLKKNVQYYYMAVELNEYIFKQLFKNSDMDKRHINLGLSDLHPAWTDGFSEIWFNRTYIEGFSTKEEAMLRLWRSLCHEYAHDSKNTVKDGHDWQFYESYEEITSKSIFFLSSCMRYITRKFLKEKYGF